MNNIAAKSKKQKNKVSTLHHAKDTGMAIALLCLIVWLNTKKTVAVIISLCILVITMTIPGLLIPVARLWFGFAGALGKVTSKILLTIIFFTAVVPVGAVRKWVGLDSLRLKAFKKKAGSGFIDRNHEFVSDDVLKPF
jgi:hypothetical protein